VPETPTGCLVVAGDLSALIDEELDAAREVEVRAHVDACEDCAQRLRELCNVDLVLAGLSAPAVADDLDVRLRARLAEVGPAATPRHRARTAPPRMRRRGTALGIAGGIAVAAAVMLAVLQGLPRDASEPGVPIAREDTPAPAARSEAPESAQAVIAEAPGPEPDGVAESPDPVPEVIARQLAPEPALIEVEPALEPATQLAGLDALPDEDVALVLELEAVEDLDLVEHLDLLEVLVDLGVADGA